MFYVGGMLKGEQLYYSQPLNVVVRVQNDRHALLRCIYCYSLSCLFSSSFAKKKQNSLQ